FGLLLDLELKQEKGGELRGKTMVVIGHNGSGNPVARRASAFGMRVIIIDAKTSKKPPFAFSIHSPVKLMDVLPAADVVVVCCPTNASTSGLLGSRQLSLLKPTAYLIDVGRPGVVEQATVAEALNKRQFAGFGLNVSSPMAVDQQLKGHPAAIVTVSAATSPEARERRWRLLRENVRRFVAGEHLLCVVEN
ncbi:MAG: NAD(P)-dependent oxidoreductase, partial [Candidatus Acidiferrum sp.]